MKEKRTEKREEILLVEDDSSLNRAVSLKLSREGYEVYTAATLKEAWEICCAHSIALIICDIGLPDGSGLDFCEKVRASAGSPDAGTGMKNGADCVFLFLTALDTETDIINGYEAGGDDYVTKPFSLAVLLSKVNAIMERYGKMSGGSEGDAGASGEKGCMIQSGGIVYDSRRNTVSKDGVYLKLTANEQKLLIYFLENPMRILSKNQLLEAIWDAEGNFVDDNTVAVNIRRLREKVEEDPSKPAVIKNVRGLGYVWERECERL